LRVAATPPLAKRAYALGMEPEEFRTGVIKVWTGFAGAIATLWDVFLLAAVNGALFLAAAGRWAWKQWLRLYKHLRVTVVAFFDSGWRKLWGWLGIAVGVYSYLLAPERHVAINYDAVNLFLGYCTGAYAWRGVEKLTSIGALRLPGVGALFPQPPEGGPRPAENAA